MSRQGRLRTRSAGSAQEHFRAPRISLTTKLLHFLERRLVLVGFGTTGDLIQIYESIIGSSVFATYNLQSVIGPVGPQAANTGAALAAFTGAPTSGGALTVTALNNFTFQVSVAPVTPPTTPAPRSLILLGIGLAMLALWNLRSKLFAILALR